MPLTFLKQLPNTCTFLNYYWKENNENALLGVALSVSAPNQSADSAGY